MSYLETLLLGAVTTLAGVVAMLWRYSVQLNAARVDDQRASARVVFALLGKLAASRGVTPPPTCSTPEKPSLAEAHTLARAELNGDTETLLRNYLASVPPEANHDPT